ncbi:hypothetical protein MRB53_013915 [Persea americana]|uniref:Uncharacterized protein n=1 Tax=Persea americana TaxID=3435 RepID=A0ACC2K9U6_PERAE|nr:hypothetical protein MRB53_013915 [Persea americana]
MQPALREKATELYSSISSLLFRGVSAASNAPPYLQKQSSTLPCTAAGHTYTQQQNTTKAAQHSTAALNF